MSVMPSSGMALEVDEAGKVRDGVRIQLFARQPSLSLMGYCALLEHLAITVGGCELSPNRGAIGPRLHRAVSGRGKQASRAKHPCRRRNFRDLGMLWGEHADSAAGAACEMSTSAPRAQNTFPLPSALKVASA